MRDKTLGGNRFFGLHDSTSFPISAIHFLFCFEYPDMEAKVSGTIIQKECSFPNEEELDSSFLLEKSLQRERFASLVHLMLGAIFLVSVFYSPLKAQEAEEKKGLIRPSTKLVIPLIFYAPETRLGFGAAGLLGFRFASEDIDSRPSNIQAGGAYTLENQLLLYLSYQTFWKDIDWQSYGEIGYYRYSYFFYGIGNDPGQRGEELYEGNFPRIRLHLLRRLTGKLYGGIELWLDDQRIMNVEEGGLLEGGIITVPGAQGGRAFAPGIMLSYDSRDQVNYPGNGIFAIFESRFSPKGLGSEFNYWRSSLDARAYLTLPWNHITASNLYIENIEGEAPFFAMATMGGNKRMRGYYEGFYRDRKYATLQFSYRMPLFWRFKLHLFGAVGGVGREWQEISREDIRSTYGADLRF